MLNNDTKKNRAIHLLVLFAVATGITNGGWSMYWFIQMFLNDGVAFQEPNRALLIGELTASIVFFMVALAGLVYIIKNTKRIFYQGG